jgi:glycosyltransferase involved in cell wall biosynthesis
MCPGSSPDPAVSHAGVPVAVLMSVFARDEPELFERALVSMERQDYGGGPVRLYLCVDGPVPSGIDAVLERHAQSIHRVLRNPENLGLARSLNRLLDALVDEQFVFRMDSDDFSHPHRISAQVEALRSLREVDILGGAIREVDPDGRVLRTVHYPADSEAARRLVARRSPLAHPTVCFRRSAIARFRRYPEVPVDQDWALWFECLRLGLGIASLDRVLVDMTISDDFFRRRGAKRALAEFRVLCGCIWRSHGVTWRYAWPAMRLAFRLMPQPLIRLAYRSRLR